MSFALNPLPGNAIAAMHPIMGTIANGSGFITPMTTTTNAATILNSSSLDFTRKQSHSQSGSAPMDLESASERDSTRDGPSTGEKKDSMVQKASQLAVDNTGGPILFNQLIQQPQGFMMMTPGMVNMMDGSSLIGMQTFPVMTQQINSAVDMTSQGLNLTQSEDGKEIIYCKSCTLFPPNPNGPAPKTIDRPPGCRTVFVGGLPNAITEEVIREIFERCGEITTLRFSKKNFCHIRYVFEASVDSAIYLSGYRVKISSGGFNYTTPEPKDPSSFGTLHVDYAHARDDQYDYECRQRKLQRERRHRERVEEDRLRPLSPQPVIHYTDHEATAVAERLKNDESFVKAVTTLITWLERGDCSKKNANNFYTMIQSTNSHVRRLLSEKAICDEELSRAREMYRKQMQSMLIEFNQIEKVFTAASHKKVWDHFTKAQRKNIDAWKKQSLDIRSIQLDDVGDDEMDLSDDEGSSAKKSRWDIRKERIDSSSEAETQSVRSDLEMKTMQIQVLQETIRNLQTQLLDYNYKEMERHNKIQDLEEKLKHANVKQLLLKTKIATTQSKLSSCTTNASSSSKAESEVDESEVSEVETKSVATAPAPIAEPIPAEAALPATIDPNEARVITLVSTFLVVHPHGASIDYIWSYVNRYVPELKVKLLEELLQRYRNLFREEVSGIGAKIERNWKFVGYESKDEDEKS